MGIALTVATTVALVTGAVSVPIMLATFALERGCDGPGLTRSQRNSTLVFLISMAIYAALTLATYLT